jgi:hypothetical protein
VELSKSSGTFDGVRVYCVVVLGCRNVLSAMLDRISSLVSSLSRVSVNNKSWCRGREEEVLMNGRDVM